MYRNLSDECHKNGNQSNRSYKLKGMNMNNLNEMTIGEIVTENYRTATVFNNYNIDFCCNGNVQFDEACRKKILTQKNY